jgi:hypothetical protein
MPNQSAEQKIEKYMTVYIYRLSIFRL